MHRSAPLVPPVCRLQARVFFVHVRAATAAAEVVKAEPNSGAVKGSPAAASLNGIGALNRCTDAGIISPLCNPESTLTETRPRPFFLFFFHAPAWP